MTSARQILLRCRRSPIGGWIARWPNATSLPQKRPCSRPDEGPLGVDAVHFPRPFVEGVIARMTNDEHKAQLAFTAARAEQEKTVQAQPDYGPAWCVLGVIDAALGRKEEALREGRRAVELLPVEKDSVNGLHMIENLAMIAAWVGEKDLACEQLATAVRCPSSG